MKIITRAFKIELKNPIENKIIDFVPFAPNYNLILRIKIKNAFEKTASFWIDRKW